MKSVKNAVAASAPLYTSAQLAKVLVPQGSDWTVDHVALALEEITIWSLEHKHTLRIERADVVREVKEMNMAASSRDAIIAQLVDAEFSCEWELPQYQAETAGFRLLSHAGKSTGAHAPTQIA